MDNLTVLLDYNDLQGYGRPTEICYFEPVRDKWEAFGWQVYEADGHNFKQLLEAFRKPAHGKPKLIIAKTLKGKGVPFMENQMKWHYYIVSEELRDRALERLCKIVL